MTRPNSDTADVRRPRTTAQQRERLASLIATFQRSYRTGPDHARGLAEEALTLATALGDDHSIAQCRQQLGLCDFGLMDYHSALINLRKACQLFEDLEEPAAAAETLLAIGSVLARQNSYAQAIEAFRSSMLISQEQESREGMAVALTALGNIYTDLGDYVTALRHHFDVLAIRESLDDGDALGVTYADIGFIYAQMGEVESALGFFTKSLDLLLERGSNMLAVRALGNIGAIHLSRGELGQALEYGLRTLVIQEQLGNRAGLAEALIAIATVHERSNRLDDALTPLLKALAIAESLEDSHLQATALIGASNIHRKRGEPWEAAVCLDRALALARETGEKRLEYTIHEAFSQTYEEIGEHAQALEHHKLFARIREELQGEEKMRAIAEIEVRVSLEKAERERELYRLKAEQLQVEVEHKTAELTAMALSIVQKNEMLDALKERVLKSMPASGKRDDTLLSTVIDQIESTRNAENDWKAFEQQLDQIHHNFMRTLSERYPELTPAELKVCALLRTNLATKEISNLLCISERTVENHRYRLRKKIGLPVDANLMLFLAGI